MAEAETWLRNPLAIVGSFADSVQECFASGKLKKSQSVRSNCKVLTSLMSLYKEAMMTSKKYAIDY